MVLGLHGQNGVIVHLIVIVVNEHVHVNVINPHRIVMEHLVKDHHLNQTHVILNHVQVLLVPMEKFLVIVQIRAIHRVQH
jgi:hypothetical protein